MKCETFAKDKIRMKSNIVEKHETFLLKMYRVSSFLRKSDQGAS